MATLLEIEEKIKFLAAKDRRDPRIQQLKEMRAQVLSGGGALDPAVTAPAAPAAAAPAPEPAADKPYELKVPYIDDLINSYIGRPPNLTDIQQLNKDSVSAFGRLPNPEESVQGLKDMGTTALSHAGRGYLDPYLDEEGAAARLNGGDFPIQMLESVAEPSFLAKLPGLAWKGGKSAKIGLEAGLDSAIDAYGHGASLSELPGAAFTGAATATGLSKLAEPVSNWFQRRNNIKNLEIKNADELAAARAAEYKTVDDASGVYRATDLNRLGGDFQKMPLRKHGDKKLYNYRKEVAEDYRNKDMSPAELDQVRRETRAHGQTRDPTKDRQRRLTGVMVDKIDKFTNKTPIYAPPKGGGQGPYAPAPQVNEALKKGRALSAKEHQLRLVQDAAAEATRKATRGRLNPFTPSAESADIMTFSDLLNKANKGRAGTTFPQPVRDIMREIEQGTARRNLGGAAEKASFTGSWMPGWLSAAAAAASSGMTLPIQMGAELVNKWGRGGTKKTIEDLGYLIMDPKSRGVRPDPAITDEARRKIAKLLSGGYRIGRREDDEDRR